MASSTVFVSNFPFATTEDELRGRFEELGAVRSVRIIVDRETGRSRGFGFVEMTTPEEAAAAIEQFNGKDFKGRNLTVNEARPRTDRAPGGGGGYNRGGGGGGGYGGGGGGGYCGGGGGGYGGGGGRRDKDRGRPSRNDREPRW